MPRKGENIRKRKDGRWEARYEKCRDQNGRIQYGYLYGRTYEAVKKKKLAVLCQNNLQNSPGKCYASPLIPNYAGIQYKKILEERFHIPCEVENDVNCAGLAEYSSGAAKGSRIALILTVGTGIGGCIVIDGKVFHGFGNSACEVGYMHMGDSDFQTLGAASTLTKKVAQWKGEPQEKWDGRHVFEEAGRGDRFCIRAIDEMTDVLGRGIANICYVIDPEVVVLGGGIMAQEDFLKGKIENALKKYLVPGMAEHTRIAFARHRNDAGMLGAFYHFCSLRRSV